MNTRNPYQRNLVPPPPAAPPTPNPTPTHLNVFTVDEYESNGKTQKRWTRIGAAFPHKGVHPVLGGATRRVLRPGQYRI
jgi:hypothetical protein